MLTRCHFTTSKRNLLFEEDGALPDEVLKIYDQLDKEHFPTDLPEELIREFMGTRLND
jgi:hypothetical protein